VDALCIIQDNVADKAAEIEAMAKIYKNATLTIAALTARSALDGFLSCRTIEGACQVPLPFPDGCTGNFSLISPSTDWSFREPLYTRAWTLQESWLSPRILCYGQQEMTWRFKSEKLTPMTISYIRYVKKNNRLPSGAFGITPRPRSTTMGDQLRVWKEIVEDYS
jgi:hypothetical protein